MKKKIVATIEARMTSTRLPGKVMLPLAGVPAIGRMVERVKRSQLIDEVIVATTVNHTDDELVEYLKSEEISYFRGSEDDVMLRVLDAAKSFNADIIVELTGDCPLVDYYLIDEMIKIYMNGNYDYVYNRLAKGLPDGFDVQVFDVASLSKVEALTKDPIDRIHVSCYFYNNPHEFRLGKLELDKDDELYWPELAVTLDEKNDYLVISKIFDSLINTNKNFSCLDVVNYLRDHPEVVSINSKVRRKSLEEG